MKLSKYLEALASFQELSKMELPISVSFDVARNTKTLKDLAMPFEETRNNLADQYKSKSELDENGNPIFTEDQMKSFKEEIDELLEMDQDISLRVVDLSECTLSVEPWKLEGCQDFIRV